MKRIIGLFIVLLFLSSLCYAEERTYLFKGHKTFCDNKITEMKNGWDKEFTMTFDIEKNDVIQKKISFLSGIQKGSTYPKDIRYKIVDKYKSKHNRGNLIRAVGVYEDSTGQHIETIILGEKTMTSAYNSEDDEIQLLYGTIVR